MEAANQRIFFLGIGLAVLAFAAVVAGGYGVAKGVTADLDRVHRAAAAIDPQVGLMDVSENLLPIMAEAGDTEEIQVLTTTINGLLERVRDVCDTQSRFLAEAAHELRTPLTAIRGEHELALRRDRSGASYRETIQLVLDDTRRMQELADILLDSARARDRGNLDLAYHGLAELVSEAWRRERQVLEDAGIKVALEIDEGIQIRANRMDISTVLDNLLANAANWSGGSRLLCNRAMTRTASP